MASDKSKLKHITQVRHNKNFHSCIVNNFPNQFFDWKITVLFYIALHYLKALAEKKGIYIGDTHFDIKKAINPRSDDTKMPITRNAWRDYKALFDYSQIARYEGFTDFETYNKLKEKDYKECLIHLERFKKYIEGKGVVCNFPVIAKQDE